MIIAIIIIVFVFVVFSALFLFLFVVVIIIVASGERAKLSQLTEKQLTHFSALFPFMYTLDRLYFVETSPNP